MFYWISYYVKRFWYVLVLIIVLSFFIIIVYMNRNELKSVFENFNNKVDYTPDKYIEEEFDGSTLSDLVVGVPYLGGDGIYVPSSLDEEEEVDEYMRELQNDPEVMYKKNISWASGSLSQEQYDDLMELVGYHLNKGNNSTSILVRTPTIEELEEYDKEVVYYTEDGVLYLTLFVEELDSNNNTKKSYCYTYELSYDENAKIVIR